MMIKLNNLSKEYFGKTGKTAALSDVSLSLPENTITGIIGKSGAGKSTLVRCMNLLERPTKGQVIINKQDLTTLPAHQLRQARRSIGMIFQHFNLIASKKVFDNIAFPLQLTKTPKLKISSRVHAILELTGLTDFKDFYPAQLSGGQKQRVAIARALANQPNVLLCDEATSALDPHNTQTILELLNNINKELGLTILLITHEMDVIKNICHRVAVLDRGKIAEENAVLDFLFHPQSAIGESFVDSCLKLNLPKIIEDRLQQNKTTGSKAIIKIEFYGQKTAEPIISNLIKQLNIDINILKANIEFIQDQPIGMMLVEVDQFEEQFIHALTKIGDKRIRAKVMGYV